MGADAMNGARRKATAAVERAARRGGHERGDSSPTAAPKTPRMEGSCGPAAQALFARRSVDAALKELTEVVERLDRRRQITALPAPSGPRSTCGATVLSSIPIDSIGRRLLIAKTTGC